MRPKFNKDGIVLYQGDCLEVMSQLPQCSVDTVITDPPYGIRFMGKAWDGADIERMAVSLHRSSKARELRGDSGNHRSGQYAAAASAAGSYDLSLNGNRAFQEWCAGWAAAVLRVVKPGGFLLAFGGTRTFHRLTCAIEDAGFEVRDCIMWLYGSGFPKSLDVSKAIDRAAGAERKTTGISSGPNHSRYKGERYSKNRSTRFGAVQDQPALTAPSTSAAKEWNGWGTGLKPAWEPIIVAMKPLDGTFARNALKHGVAGLRIDGVRIPATDTRSGGFGDGKRPWQSGPVGGNTNYVGSEQGRWPANVILDEKTGKMLDEQSGERAAGGAPLRRFSPPAKNVYGEYGMDCPPGIGRSRGGASRFFYCAKASKNERDLGLRKGLLNGHPTVKPLKLMEYLCKLTATPTGGIILDPFAGSGSTMMAAANVGRKCIGIECDREYVRIAQARLRAHATKKLKGGSSKAA